MYRGFFAFIVLLLYILLVIVLVGTCTLCTFRVSSLPFKIDYLMELLFCFLLSYITSFTLKFIYYNGDTTLTVQFSFLAKLFHARFGVLSKVWIEVMDSNIFSLIFYTCHLMTIRGFLCPKHGVDHITLSRL